MDHSDFDLSHGAALGAAGTPFVATAGDDRWMESSAVSYEQLLRHHIDEFMRGCEKYAAETQLSQRVSDWRDRMDPLLKEQDVRPEFDILKYGSTVVEQLEGLDGTLRVFVSVCLWLCGRFVRGAH